ncbi:hypothetical protein JL722_6870 [Aureococcus anophagefferens]|nr:hypothetical protein JL722_6870 [Aureococcus anophagefferens]
MDAIAAAEKLKEAEEAKKLAEEAKKLEKEREANGGGACGGGGRGAARRRRRPWTRRPTAPGAGARARRGGHRRERREARVAAHGRRPRALIDCLEMISGGFPNPARAQQASDALLSKSLTCNGGIGALALRARPSRACSGPSRTSTGSRRSKLGKPLLRRFWPKTAPTDTNPHCVFRPREKERYKLRKHRKNDEAVKRLKLDAGRGALRRTLDGLAASRASKLGASFAFADGADYKLTAKELKDASRPSPRPRPPPRRRPGQAAAAAAAARRGAPAARSGGRQTERDRRRRRPKPKKAKGPKRSPDDVVAAVLAERLAAVAVRPPVEEEVYDGGDEFGRTRRARPWATATAAGPACPCGFMDSAWWGATTALAALGEHRFLDPPIRADLAPVPPPRARPKPRTRWSCRPTRRGLVERAAPALRVGARRRVLVDRYRAHRVPKRAPVAASTTSSQSAQSASPRHGAAPANDLRAPNVRVSYAARARRRAAEAAAAEAPRAARGQPPQPPPPPPPPPPVVEVRPCAACRGAHSAHTCGTRGASAEAAATARERGASPPRRPRRRGGGGAAAPPDAAAAAARVDVGRTRGATQRLHAASDAWDAEPPARGPAAARLGRAPRRRPRPRGAAALRRPPTTIVPQRRGDLRPQRQRGGGPHPIDAPDPAPSQLRVKLSVDV